MSNTQNWANKQYIPYNNPPQYQDQPPQFQYDNYMFNNYQRGYEQQPDPNYYQEQYNNPYSQNYQFQQPPQQMGYPYSMQTNNNNAAQYNNQIYIPQSLDPTMNRDNQTKTMAGYKRMNYQQYNQSHLMQHQPQLRPNAGSSFSSHYPTYDKLPSYNAYFPNKLQINPIMQQQDKRIEQPAPPSITDKQDNMNIEIKTGKTLLTLNPKAEPYQRKAPPITETARQAEPVPPPVINSKTQLQLPKQINEPKAKSPKKEEPKKMIIERGHFEVPKHADKNKESTSFKWAITYLKSFQNWDLSNAKDLLNSKALNHLERMKIHFDEGPNTTNNNSNKNTYNKGKFSNLKGNDYAKNDKRIKQNDDNMFVRGEAALQSDMGKWGRKDFSEEVKKAEIFKKKLDEIKEQDPIKFDLTEYLNMLTVDNYNETKQLIFNKIKDGIENQKKFLEVLFQKAVHEKAFVNLYAKLCKDLDRELPQKVERTHNKKAGSSEMRSKLIDKCKEIFKIDNNEQIDGYIKVKDPEERENKIKKFILGNVNFIGELINIKLLSKKVVFQCIEMLFTRYDKGDEGGLRLINLEGIVILTDKFGTLIHKQRDSIEDNDFKDFVSNINTILVKLNKIQMNDDIPGYVKYKIINLIEKKKGGWEESQYEKNIVAKGKEEIRKAYEESQRKGTNKDPNNKQLTQEQIDNRIRDDLTEFKDFIEEGNNLDKYTWEIITEIYNDRKHSIAEIMRSFIENCIDFVQNENTLSYSQQYWEELIRYYGPGITMNEKNEIIEQTLELLETVNSISLDNPMLLDVWANILISLNKHDVMNYYELNNLAELGDNDLKSIFEIMKKIGKIDRNSLKAFEKISVVIKYKELYDDIIEEE